MGTLRTTFYGVSMLVAFEQRYKTDHRANQHPVRSIAPQSVTNPENEKRVGITRAASRLYLRGAGALASLLKHLLRSRAQIPTFFLGDRGVIIGRL